uniref:Uncharacterized protein n=1 Tax=Rhizophora mucronata TaxID=61149 RepID=A0A2P2L6U2_RHIMU
MMVAIAFSDKSRDYTIPDASLLTAAQAPGLLATQTAWQNPQAASGYPGTSYAAAAAVPGPVHAGQLPSQVPAGQVPTWDPTIQASGAYLSVSGTFTGQTYPVPPVPAYATAAMPAGSSPLSQGSPISPGMPSMAMTQPGVQPNMRPSGASSTVQPPYYGR